MKAVRDDRFRLAECLAVPHAQPMNFSLLVDRVKSSSRTIVQRSEQRTALLARVEEFARERFGEGTFEFPLLTRAWPYRRREPQTDVRGHSGTPAQRDRYYLSR
jgi:hypothetical protein